MLNRRFTLVLAYLAGPLAAGVVLAAVALPENLPDHYALLSALPALALGLLHLLLSRLFRAPGLRASLNKALVTVLFLQALVLGGLEAACLFHPDSVLAPAALAAGPILLAAACLAAGLLAFPLFSFARSRA